VEVLLLEPKGAAIGESDDIGDAWLGIEHGEVPDGVHRQDTYSAVGADDLDLPLDEHEHPVLDGPSGDEDLARCEGHLLEPGRHTREDPTGSRREKSRPSKHCDSVNDEMMRRPWLLRHSWSMAGS